VFLSAFERPDFERRTAIIFRDRKYTYGQIATEARLIAGGLQSSGIRPGDRIALYMRNSDQFIPAYLACEWIGSVAVPIRYSEAGVFAISWCNHMGVKSVIADDELIESITSHASELTSCRSVVTPLQARIAAPNPEKYPHVVNDGKPLLIVHTSGSTAQPKAVMQGLDALNAHARAMIEYLPLRPDDVVCVVSDLSHGFGLNTLATLSFAVGAAVLVFNQSEYDDETIIHEMTKQGATIVGSNPVRFRRLLLAARRLAELHSVELPKLRFALSSTDKLPDDVAIQWKEIFGTPLLECWGMTETCSCVLFNRPGDHEVGTVGRPIPNVEVRIVGSEDRDVLDGDVGEMWLAGDFLFSGYWNDPEATQRATYGGWFRTGDQFIRHPSDRYRFVGRGGYSIKRGGILGSVFEIESAFMRHPAVAECVAVTVPSKEWGQDIELFLKLRSSVSAIELRAHADMTCGIFMRPSRYWSVSAIPETSAGKVARNIEKLRAAAEPLN
jgi:acyl-CoA synthetase (AMP-forming)/AMP-acid ligase II